MAVPVDPRLRVPPRPTQPIAQPRVIGDPQDFKETTIQQIGETADGSQTNTQRRIGYNGTIVSAQITNIGNNDIQPGDAYGQAEVYRGLFSDPEQTNQNKLYTLCKGPITQSRGPAGYGSLPVQAGDLLNLRTWFRVGGQWGLKITGLPGPTLPPNWSGEYTDPSTDVFGSLLDQTLGDPAAGSDYTTEDVPTNVNWLVKSIRATLVTDATVANRQFYVEFRDASDDVKYRTRLHDDQQATETRQYNFAIGGTPYHAAEDGNNDLHQELPVIWLEEGYDINFTTTGLVAGDDFGEGFLEVKERLMVQ